MKIVYEEELKKMNDMQRASILKDIAKGLIKYGGSNEQDKNSRN